MRLPAPNRQSEQGVAIILVLITAFVGFVMVASLLGLSTQTGQLTWRTMAQERADAAADAALETTFGLVLQDLLDPTNGGVAVVSQRVADGFYDLPVSNWVASGTQAAVADFGIVSVPSTNYGETSFLVTAQTQVHDPAEGRSRASFNLRLLDVPVTGFSLCYDVDLEHYPWHNWTVTGPVYCGQRAYFCPVGGATLTFQDQVFAVDGIVLGPHPLEAGTTFGGAVEYESETDSAAPAMVQPPAPVGSTNRMHWILEQPQTSDYGTPTGNQRFVNKADVVVSISTAGNAVVRKGPKYGSAFVADSLPAGIMYSTNLFDGREARTAALTVLQADMVPTWMGTVFGAAVPAHPILYIDDQRTWGASAKFSAVRVENGAILGGTGFTLATPNPLYVQGDFNRVSPKPVLLAGDAITVLSGAWRDGDGALPLLDPARTASTTIVNAAVVTGIVPADGSYGSGWVANVLRLLENWGECDLAFNGSLAVLYHSESATGVFEHGTYYYRPRERTFAFTNFFATLGQTNVPSFKMALRRDFQRLQPE